MANLFLVFCIETRRLTKQEHIAYWVGTAKRDWRAVQNMCKSKDYLHALFFAHVVLEKLCKAHWVKDNPGNIPPKIHNLVMLVAKTKFKLSEGEMQFLSEMNQFQLEGRYPDSTQQLYKTYKGALTQVVLQKVNTIRKCLLKDL